MDNDTLFADLNMTDDDERADANVLPTVLFGILSFMLMLALVGVFSCLVRGWPRSGWRPCHSQVRARLNALRLLNTLHLTLPTYLRSITYVLTYLRTHLLTY